MNTPVPEMKTCKQCGQPMASDAPEDALREIERLALEGCPGISTLREPVPVETQLEVTRTAAERAA